MFMFRIMLVFLPCSPTSSLFSQSNPNNDCVLSFSVMSIDSTTLLFSDLTSTFASLLNFIGFLFTSAEHLVAFFSSIGVKIGGIIVMGDLVSMMDSIGCPPANRIAL